MGLNKKMTKIYQVRKKKTFLEKDPFGDLRSVDSKDKLLAEKTPLPVDISPLLNKTLNFE